MQPLDSGIVRTAIVAFAAVLGLFVLAFTVAAWAAFRSERVGAPQSLGLLFQRAGALRLLTVMLVVFATVLLAILDRLSEGSIAVLSGIAGYVLGGLDRGNVASEHAKTDKRSQDS